LKILTADFILTCNEDFDVLTHGAICFDKTIVEVGRKEDLIKKYPNAEVTDLPKNSILMPGLINPHVHLEFSSNTSSLAYGDFMSWLNSVIEKRDDLLLTCSDEIIEEQLKIMLQSGTTTIGAVSSFGNDFDACLRAKQRVVFFTEVLGSRPDSVDILFDSFKSRLRIAQDNESERFIPAISIHSPYSTHPILAKNALDLARKFGYAVSTHFMEARAERDWLDNGKGEFYDFFANFSPYAKPLCTALEYIELFRGTKTLFTHCVQATANELEAIKNIGGAVTHCPVSNRLLGVGKLDMKKVEETHSTLTIGTDGLSSNISLNLWDEMRAVIFTHTQEALNDLAKKVLIATTKDAATALNLNCGQIAEGKFADLIVCQMAQEIENKEDLPLQLILHTKHTHLTFIAGESV
jgi:cytosine/adenosine deaminase-related metal-dependent hydrolase